jgi:hypothetical protein
MGEGGAVLTGDAGDNIKSIKRKVPRKPTKADPREETTAPIGTKAAEEILANGSVEKTAEEQGWMDELEFNATMIYLASTPVELQAEIKKAVSDALSNLKRIGRIDSFGISMDDLKLMRNKAIMKTVKFSGAGTAETGE